jgi:glycosyltransferase involved in cell wall biosynthesis
MKFDIIITTYNRPTAGCDLVTQIIGCSLLPEKIIIVDSSEVKNEKILEFGSVIYIQSSHKNQPYQRYLGYLASTEEVIVFLDDDIKIINNQIFNIILERFEDPMVVGSNVRFKQEGDITVQKELDKVRPFKNSKLVKLFWWITGVPMVSSGKVWLAGLKGPDSTNIYTESLGGPGSLSFRRVVIPTLFDDILFSLFEKKMAMGEDKYISMGALRFGRLAFNNTTCIIHPANDSNYFQDIGSFVRKEIYSRLFLSRRYLQVKQRWIGWAYIHFYWYGLWRIVISCIYFILHPVRHNKQQLKGKLLGVYDAIRIPFKASILCPGIIWEHELLEDLKQSGL